MDNPILASINSVFQPQESQQIGGAGGFDLTDDRFANILNGELDKLQEDNEPMVNNIMEKLGVPAGLTIEGFDYNSIASEMVDSTDAIDPINTESDIQDDNKFDAKSLIRDAAEAFSPVVGSVLNSEFNFNSENATNPLKAVKNFWQGQASNLYNIMNKEMINDIGDLVAKL